jgi:hypothetical protein
VEDKLQKLVTASPRTERIAWLVLGAAIAVSATWLLLAGHGLSFASDDLFYYAHFVTKDGANVPTHGLEWFFAPANGHLTVFGKLVYEALFEIAGGGNYWAFQAFNLFGVMTCVILFFVFAKRRIGPIPALVPCVSLLFLGYGWEALLWAFDMHTIYALAFGLGALLLLERNERQGDVGACVLLVLSIGMIELGLAFAFGAAVIVLWRADRWRRIWVFLVPLALYAIWWLWSRQFDQSSIALSNIRLFPKTVTDALAAIAGSVFGLNPTGPGVPQPITEITAWGAVVAGIAVVSLVYRISRGKVPAELWAFAVVALGYWGLIALGARGADSSRYIFTGTTLVFFVMVAALRGVALSWKVVGAAACLIAIAIPANVQKLYDGRLPQLGDGKNGRVEYAMLDLARGHVRPDYAPGKDHLVGEAGGATFTALEAGDYLRAAEEFGPIGFSPQEVTEQSSTLRRIADLSLIGALRVRAVPTDPPAGEAGCRTLRPDGPEATLQRGGALIGVPGEGFAMIDLRRFADPGESYSLVRVGKGGWVSLRIPPDSAPTPWRVAVDAPALFCPR